jgi:translation initiation factor IF-1
MNASRKGLRIEPEDEDIVSLWKEYKSYARTLWKKMKG